MGFSYNDITSKSMGLKARLTSWQVSGRLRNFTTTVPGKYGVADFGADFDYREIRVACNIYAVLESGNEIPRTGSVE